jgi:hypothetical protein
MAHTITLTIADESYRCLTFLEPHEVPAGGPPVAALVGRAPAGVPFGPDTVETNPEFLGFLHDTLADFGPHDPSLRAAALKQQQGYLYVLDLRSSSGGNGGEVQREDVIGAFEVHEGRIVDGSYRALDGWRPYTAAGAFRLPSWLQRLLRDRVLAAASPA